MLSPKQLFLTFFPQKSVRAPKHHDTAIAEIDLHTYRICRACLYIAETDYPWKRYALKTSNRWSDKAKFFYVSSTKDALGNSIYNSIGPSVNGSHEALNREILFCNMYSQRKTAQVLEGISWR